MCSSGCSVTLGVSAHLVEDLLTITTVTSSLDQSLFTEPQLVAISSVESNFLPKLILLIDDGGVKDLLGGCERK